MFPLLLSFIALIKGLDKIKIIITFYMEETKWKNNSGLFSFALVFVSLEKIIKKSRDLEDDWVGDGWLESFNGQ